MAFSTLRGRPRKPLNDNDPGTPELRLKHALKLTAEPIDICLEKKLITDEHHWCGLHLRWLYTLRYGAPSLTTHYTDTRAPASPETADDPAWRAMREQEYHEAANLLKSRRYYEPVMRLCIFNESPAFLNPRLLHQAKMQPCLAERLSAVHQQLHAGLELLRHQWRRPSALNCNRSQNL